MVGFSYQSQSATNGCDVWLLIRNSNSLGGLVDGNTGGTIVMYLINFAAFSTIILSLAEMASMAPTAGGQYHWASEVTLTRNHLMYLEILTMSSLLLDPCRNL